VKTVQLTEARGQLAGARVVRDGYQVMLISTGGTVIRIPVEEIKRLGRATRVDRDAAAPRRAGLDSRPVVEGRRTGPTARLGPTKSLRRLLRRQWIDVDAGAELEPGGDRQPGQQLQVPVPVACAERRRVQPGVRGCVLRARGGGESPLRGARAPWGDEGLA
jgi:hypothetical protein